MKNLYQKILLVVLSIGYTIVVYSQNTYAPNWVIKQEPVIYHNQDGSNVYISSKRDTIFYATNTYNGTSAGIKYKRLPGNTEHTLVEIEEGTLIDILHRDQQGNFYIAGLTTATENFATPNVYKSEYETNGIENANGYIAKYSSNGQLLWRTYTFYIITGGYAIKHLATDEEGNVYFVEYIPYDIVLENAPFQSTATIAETVHPLVSQIAPAITKLNSEGQLVWSTFYCNHFNGVGKLITTQNRLWITGYCNNANSIENNNPTFYATSDAPITNQYTSENQSFNEYLSAFDFDGNRVFSTYLRNTPSLSGYHAVQTLQAGSNQVYVVYSNQFNDLPILENSVVWGNTFRMSAFDDNDGYLYTVTTDCKSLSVDANDRLFFAGQTRSTEFPVTEEAYQPQKAMGTFSNGEENYDAYVQIIDASATENIYSSYFGESGSDGFTRIFPTSSGYYVLGGTGGNSSPDAMVTAPPYLDLYTDPQSGISTYGGAFLARFSTSSLGVAQPMIKGLSIYPNPTAGQLTLSLAEDFVEDFSFEWYNLQGQKIPLESQQTTTEIRWNLESLATGVYLLKVSKGKEAQQTFRVIKE